jgi:hypothetical protein
MGRNQKIIFFSITVIALFLFFATVWPLTADYSYVFWPVVRSFIEGDTKLYDEFSRGFFNAPWAIFILLPIGYLPVKYGQALLITIQLIGLVLAVDHFTEKRNNKMDLLIIFLALANIHTFGLLASGNLDGLLVIGILASWMGAKDNKPILFGTGLWLLSIKPINILFAIPVLVKKIWGWSMKDKLLSLGPLIVTILISFPVFGLNWINRYFEAMSSVPPNIKPQTSLWRLLSFLGIQTDLALWIFCFAGIIFLIFLLRSKQVEENMLHLGLSSNLVFSPYALGNHYVLLAPAFAMLAQKYPWMISFWLLSFSPLIRLVWGFEVAWVDLVYPLCIMLGVIYLMKEKKDDPGI